MQGYKLSVAVEHLACCRPGQELFSGWKSMGVRKRKSAQGQVWIGPRVWVCCLVGVLNIKEWVPQMPAVKESQSQHTLRPLDVGIANWDCATTPVWLNSTYIEYWNWLLTLNLLIWYVFMWFCVHLIDSFGGCPKSMNWTSTCTWNLGKLDHHISLHIFQVHSLHTARLLNNLLNQDGLWQL